MLLEISKLIWLEELSSKCGRAHVRNDIFPPWFSLEQLLEPISGGTSSILLTVVDDSIYVAVMF